MKLPVICEEGFSNEDVKEHQILVAENVEVDMETLEEAQSFRVHPLTREQALNRVLEAVIKALYPEDREKLEAWRER